MADNEAEVNVVALLEGEDEIETLRQGACELLLTNRRIIRSCWEGRKYEAEVAFLRDIVFSGVSYTGKNPLYLVLAIVLSLAGVGWFAYNAVQGDASSWAAIGGIVGGIVLGIVFTVLYIGSGEAAIVFGTASGTINFDLGARANEQAYPFVNLCLKTKERDRERLPDTEKQPG